MTKLVNSDGFLMYSDLCNELGGPVTDSLIKPSHIRSCMRKHLHRRKQQIICHKSLILPQSNLRLIKEVRHYFCITLAKQYWKIHLVLEFHQCLYFAWMFQQKILLEDSYSYEVLGCQYMVTAKTKLFKENSDNAFISHELAEVYAELSNKKALRLASWHNRNGVAQIDS